MPVPTLSSGQLLPKHCSPDWRAPTRLLCSLQHWPHVQTSSTQRCSMNALNSPHTQAAPSLLCYAWKVWLMQLSSSTIAGCWVQTPFTAQLSVSTAFRHGNQHSHVLPIANSTTMSFPMQHRPEESSKVPTHSWVLLLSLSPSPKLEDRLLWVAQSATTVIGFLYICPQLLDRMPSEVWVILSKSHPSVEWTWTSCYSHDSSISFWGPSIMFCCSAEGAKNVQIAGFKLPLG